jgi:predicted ATP-dependent endonuclease of OLD family
MSLLPQRIEKLLVNKQMDGVIAALQEIDPKITDIRMGATGIIYVDIGLEKLLPINIMGDGIRRIFSILAAVSDMQGGILLIDEIENGLHYSTLEILWKALLKAVERYHVQNYLPLPTQMNV